MGRLIAIESGRRLPMLLWVVLAMAVSTALTFVFTTYVMDASAFIELLPTELCAAFSIDGKSGGNMTPVFLTMLAATLAGAVSACFIGGCSFASDIESGAIELLYSKPVSRFQIFLSKLLFVLLPVLAGTAICCAECWLLYRFIGTMPMYFLNVLLYGGLLILIVMLFFSSFSMLLSSMFSSGVSASLTAMIMMLVLLLLGASGKFLSMMEPYSEWSPFVCLSVFRINSPTGFPIRWSLIFAAITLLFFSASAIVMEKRDLIS